MSQVLLLATGDTIACSASCDDKMTPDPATP